KIELAFLSKKFDAQEIKELKTKLNRNKYLKETELLIRQDSDDKQDPLKNDLLNKIKSSENEMDAKDLKVLHLEKELAKNKFDNEQLLKETKTLFPAISSLSVTKTNFVTESDSTYAITAVIYDGKGTFNETDQKKFKDWLSARLAVKDVEIFKKQ
ncbi:MAG: hypothetical protein RRY99_13870, partial [Flavobacterium sp.]